ncbi:hypothetical protein HHI36_016025 [Cryptolaemus montrouzieri]|uniref:RNase H type-1 domain-containing protein n=1 Tax=Cryptolaemus montrouzieri TaxID=559131 RepID=A0ABD2N7T3_9CUCU
MSTEAFGIYLALKFIEQRDFLSTVNCSDSLSCLKENNNNLISIIRDELCSTINCIVLLYTAAYCGIIGNKEADSAAKNAVNMDLPAGVPIDNRDWLSKAFNLI